MLRDDGARPDRSEFISMSRLSRLFFGCRGPRGFGLKRGHVHGFFLGDVIFCFVAVVSLGSRIFAVTFGLNALFFLGGVVFGSGHPNPPFRPRSRFDPQLPREFAALTPQHQGRAFKLTVAAAVTVVAASCEPSVVCRAHGPSRVRHRASECVVAAPAQSWAGF